MFRDLSDAQLAEVHRTLAVTITANNAVELAARLFILMTRAEVITEMAKRASHSVSDPLAAGDR